MRCTASVSRLSFRSYDYDNSEAPDTTCKINKKKEETGNYKALCVSRKRKKPVSNRIKLIFCVTTRLFDDVLSCNQETWSID